MALVLEQREITLGFKEGKPKAYKLAVARQQEISFDELLDEVSNSCGVGRGPVKAAVEGLIDRMSHFMKYGMPVRLGDFGLFRPSVNCDTEADASELSTDNVVRRKIVFTPGKRFKSMLANVSLRTIDNADDDADAGSGSGSPGGGGTDTDEGTGFE